MPLTPRYDWSQTDACIRVQVHIPGFRKAAADIVVTSCCVKVNHPPYVLLLDLHGEVDAATSSAVVSHEGVAFTLSKVAPGSWEALVSTDDKKVREKRRNDAIEGYYHGLQTAHNDALQRKQAEEKLASTRQWDLEKSKRQAIEKAKEEELGAARTDLAAWEAAANAQDSDTESDEEEQRAVEQAMPDHDDYHGKGWRPDGQSSTPPLASRPAAAPEPQHDMDEDAKSTASDQSSSDDFTPPQPNGAGTPEDAKQYPKPRDSMPVQVQFTKLQTDHLPAREAREEEIRLHKKQTAAAQAGGDSVDISERQPVFLKDKGNAMFKQGNYQGAINAYTRALELDRQLPLVWANRAACHLKSGAYDACVADCGEVLAMLQPAAQEGRAVLGMDVAAMRGVIAKALARRGAAYAESGRCQLAVHDYSDAIQYDPQSSVLQAALQELQLSMQPTSVATIKARGDARYKGGDYEGAAEAYTVLLSLPDAATGDLVAARSNRSACSLLMGLYTDAAADCDAALALLTATGAAAEPPVTAAAVADLKQAAELCSLIDALDSEKRKKAVRLLSRRGTAFTYLKRYGAAVRDYQAAQALLAGLGEAGRAAEMQEDIRRVQELQQGAAAKAGGPAAKVPQLGGRLPAGSPAASPPAAGTPPASPPAARTPPARTPPASPPPASPPAARTPAASPRAAGPPAGSK